jgi:hypothetical protein
MAEEIRIEMNHGGLMRTVIVLAALLSAGTLHAQEHPSFAGRWTVAPDSAGAGRGARPGDMGSGWGSPLTITQDATTLTVEYAFFTRGDMQPPLKFSYSLTGAETKNTVMMGRGIQEQLSKTKWEGNRLVITTLHPFQDPSTGRTMNAQVMQALSLDSPTTLIVETTRVGVLGGPTSVARARYTKS